MRRKTIAEQAIALLVLAFTVRSSHLVAIQPCSSLLCGQAINQSQVQSECSQLTGNASSCKCYKYLNSNKVLCSGFSKPPLLFNVFKSDVLDDLAVIMHRRKPFGFTTLIDKFLTYLPMTQITEFSVTVIGSSNSDQRCYSLEEKSQTTTLHLSREYKENNVRKLSLMQCYISIILGNFSSVFPLLTELRLNQNYLEILQAGIFQNLHHIEIIDLNCNRLHITENNSLFTSLSSLTYLDLSVNRIDNIGQNVSYNLVNLQVLNISKNDLKYLSPQLFHRNVELREIDLSHCYLNTLAETHIDRLAKLKSLSLQSNNISNFPPEILHSNSSLSYLNLKNNKLSNFSFGAGQFTKLMNLDLTNNCLNLHTAIITSTEKLSRSHKTIKNIICQNCCLNTKEAGYIAKFITQLADFRQNPIGEIDMDFLSNVAHLKTVILNKYDATYNYSGRTQMTLHQLKITIDLTYPLFVDENMQLSQTVIFISEYAYSNCEFVTFMMINRNNIKSPNCGMRRSNMTFIINNITVANRTFTQMYDVLDDLFMSTHICKFTFYCPKKCICTTNGFSEIIAVNCTHKRMFTFPNTEVCGNPLKLYLNNNFIQHLPALPAYHWERFIEIHLENNWLVSMDNFKLTPHLQILDLRSNRLKHFSFLLVWLPPTDYQTQLLLSGNPWICDCDILKMKNYLNTGNNSDFIKVVCMSISAKSLVFASNATANELCPPDPHMLVKILVPVFASFLVVVSFSALLCYRYRAVIKFWLFTHGFCLRFVTEEDVDADKIYDAFVSFSSLDAEWVDNYLVPGLENQPPFYKLCLHDRDWPVGEWIIEQILLSVKQSRRTIIVLTDNFLSSDWSLLEFRAACKQALEDRVNRVLVVLPGKIPDTDKLGNEFSTFISFNTYTKWDDPYFWWKLRCGMPRVRDRRRPTDQQETMNL